MMSRTRISIRIFEYFRRRIFEYTLSRRIPALAPSSVALDRLLIGALQQDQAVVATALL